MTKLTTIIFNDPNSEPPKNWLWQKDKNIYKYNYDTHKWDIIDAGLPIINTLKKRVIYSDKQPPKKDIWIKDDTVLTWQNDQWDQYSIEERMLNTPLTVEGINFGSTIANPILLRCDYVNRENNNGYPEIADIEYKINDEPWVNVKDSPYLFYLNRPLNTTPQFLPALIFFSHRKNIKKVSFRGDLNNFLVDNTDQGNRFIGATMWNSALMWLPRVTPDTNRFIVEKEWNDMDGIYSTSTWDEFYSYRERIWKLRERLIKEVCKANPINKRTITQKQLDLYKKSYFEDEETLNNGLEGFWETMFEFRYVTPEEYIKYCNNHELPEDFNKYDSLTSRSIVDYELWPNGVYDKEYNEIELLEGSEWSQAYNKFCKKWDSFFKVNDYSRGDWDWFNSVIDSSIIDDGHFVFSNSMFYEMNGIGMQVYGNIMSLLSHDFKNLNEIKVSGQFYDMFGGIAYITKDKPLLLPATILPNTSQSNKEQDRLIIDRYRGVYQYLLLYAVLDGCTIKLPALEANEYDYKGLFSNAYFNNGVNIECLLESPNTSITQDWFANIHAYPEDLFGCFTKNINANWPSDTSGTGSFTCIIDKDSDKKEAKIEESPSEGEQIKPKNDDLQR